VDKTLRVEGTRRRINLARRSAIHKISGIKPTEPKTRAKKKSTVEEQFGIKIPRSTREALLFDRENGNNKWAEAMAKEMAGLERLGVFNYHSPTVEFKKEEGWQFAPLRMIFSIKQQDLRHFEELTTIHGRGYWKCILHGTTTTKPQNLEQSRGGIPIKRRCQGVPQTSTLRSASGKPRIP